MVPQRNLSGKERVAQSQRKTGRKPVHHKAAAPFDPTESDDNTALARALSDIVAGRATARAKLAQIESLIANPGKSSLPKRGKGNNPPTDDHSVKSLQGKIEREFNYIEHAAQNSIDASISAIHNTAGGIMEGVDELLIAYGVKSERIRSELARAFSFLVERVTSGQNIDAALAAAVKAESETRAPYRKLSPIPKVASKLFAERKDKSQNIIDFLREPDGLWPWIEARMLTTQTLLALDRPAYFALASWRHRHGELPPDIDIPTRTTVIDRMLGSGDIPPEALPKVGHALAQRLHRQRRKRSPNREL